LAEKKYQELLGIKLAQSGRKQLWREAGKCGLFLFVPTEYNADAIDTDWL
jgi:hypothetical protein